jgi:probable rRNA maturation factor
VSRRGLPNAASFRRWSLGARVTIRVVGEREGLLLNKKYRGKAAPTNVLTFATGDVVLCHPLIAREARAQGKTLAAHYAHLVVHGVLHLRGHDHLKKKDAARMERAEIRALRRLGFADPYE